MTVGVDGAGGVVTSPAYPENIGFGGASWSPDGSRIAVEHFAAIEVFANGSTTPTPITPQDIGCETGKCVFYFSPTWSPDSSKMAAIQIDQKVPASRVVVMNADGSDITPISADIGYVARLTPLAWSNDGIAFTTLDRPGGSYSVWAVNPDGSNLRQLIAPQATIPAPYWFLKP